MPYVGERAWLSFVVRDFIGLLTVVECSGALRCVDFGPGEREMERRELAESGVTDRDNRATSLFESSPEVVACSPAAPASISSSVSPSYAPSSPSSPTDVAGLMRGERSSAGEDHRPTSWGDGELSVRALARPVVRVTDNMALARSGDARVRSKRGDVGVFGTETVAGWVVLAAVSCPGGSGLGAAADAAVAAAKKNQALVVGPFASLA